MPFMKIALTLATLLLVCVRSFAQSAVEIDLEIDAEAQEITTFHAPEQAVKQTEKWQFGSDSDLLPSPKLVEIAKQEALRQARKKNARRSS